MANADDKEDLLDALYEHHVATGKRPSVVEAQMRYLPEWDRNRLFDTAEALEADGDIMNPAGPVLNVDLSSTARKRAASRKSLQHGGSTTINIGEAHNSPIQTIGAGGYGTQNTHYQVTKNDLEEIVRVYRRHVDELKLDDASRRRADAQVATIEAQLQDEPDPAIIKAAGRSLKTIVEGAIGGALGNALANAGVWAPLLAIFG